MTESWNDPPGKTADHLEDLYDEFAVPMKHAPQKCAADWLSGKTGLLVLFVFGCSALEGFAETTASGWLAFALRTFALAVCGALLLVPIRR